MNSTPTFGNVTIIDDGGKNVIDFLLAQINQLQAEFAALLALYNAHQHSALNAAPGGTWLATATKTGQITVKK